VKEGHFHMPSTCLKDGQAKIEDLVVTGGQNDIRKVLLSFNPTTQLNIIFYLQLWRYLIYCETNPQK
jgi:hypothetical protein